MRALVLVFSMAFALACPHHTSHSDIVELCEDYCDRRFECDTISDADECIDDFCGDVDDLLDITVEDCHDDIEEFFECTLDKTCDKLDEKSCPKKLDDWQDSCDELKKLFDDPFNDPF